MLTLSVLALEKEKKKTLCNDENTQQLLKVYLSSMSYAIINVSVGAGAFLSQWVEAQTS